jgi:hypothetical protein
MRLQNLLVVVIAMGLVAGTLDAQSPKPSAPSRTSTTKPTQPKPSSPPANPSTTQTVEWNVQVTHANPAAMAHGAADLTRAQGDYLVKLQEARLAREEARQAALVTDRKRREHEAWIEENRPTYEKLRDARLKAELERARNNASTAEITSGLALNALLKSILSNGSSQLKDGPEISLDEDTLKRLNIAATTTTPNAGLLKDGAEFAWPEALEAEDFDTPRERMVGNLRKALSDIRGGKRVAVITMREIRSDYETLQSTLERRVTQMTPGKFIEARRFLASLNSAVKAISDPKTAKSLDNDWVVKNKTVGELVESLNKKGVIFNAATEGDEAAYRATYNALREFEAGMRVASR